jgi:hypothetical protein
MDLMPILSDFATVAEKRSCVDFALILLRGHLATSLPCQEPKRRDGLAESTDQEGQSLPMPPQSVAMRPDIAAGHSVAVPRNDTDWPSFCSRRLPSSIDA